MPLQSRGRSAIQNGVDTLTTFQVGNVSGSGPEFFYDTGQLPEPYRTEYRTAHRDNRIRYVIRSYKTPIAWLIGDDWTVPDVKYSRTTSGHQSVTRTAIGHPGLMSGQPSRRTYNVPRSVAPVRVTVPVPTPVTDIVADIDATLQSVAADGWTNPYTDSMSPALRLSSRR